MTNQEFTSIKPDETQFIQALNEIFVSWYSGKKDGEFTRFSKTKLGGYLWKINGIVSEINQNIEDIRFAEKMLLSHEPTNLVLNKQENSAHSIRYHYENYIIRATKIKDLSLSLINQVMQLGIKKSLNMENQILKRVDPKYGKFPVIWGYMRTLTDYIKPYRNHLAHNGSVQHKDLALLHAHYIYKIEPTNVFDEFRYEASMVGLQQELVDKFTAQIKAHLTNSEQVLKMIYVYLTKPFLDNLNVLVKEYNDPQKDATF